MSVNSFSIYDAMVRTCTRHGYTVRLEDGVRGLVIRVFDVSGAQACHTLIGDNKNRDAGAVSILQYLKPLLSIEREPEVV